jgi:hypothetical protein
VAVSSNWWSVHIGAGPPLASGTVSAGAAAPGATASGAAAFGDAESTGAAEALACAARGEAVTDGPGEAVAFAAADCDEASEFRVAQVVKPKSTATSTAATAALRRQ